MDTLFLSPLVAAFGDNVDDPMLSRGFIQFDGDIEHTVVFKKFESLSLDDTETKTFSFANYTRSEWSFVLAKVVGEAAVNLAGKDYDGATDISSTTVAYGTDEVPGFAVISTYNVDTFEIESLADSTTIELYAAILAEDDDPRLDE